MYLLVASNEDNEIKYSPRRLHLKVFPNYLLTQYDVSRLLNCNSSKNILLRPRWVLDRKLRSPAIESTEHLWVHCWQSRWAEPRFCSRDGFAVNVFNDILKYPTSHAKTTYLLSSRGCCPFIWNVALLIGTSVSGVLHGRGQGLWVAMLYHFCKHRTYCGNRQPS